MMKERKVNGVAYYAGDWPLDMGKATLIFIHGAGGSGIFWQAQVESLAARANTLSIELPGHGGSDGEGLDKIEDYAQAVVGFIQAIDVPRPIPCGLSMGGAITQQLMLECPHLLKAGILIGTGSRLKVAPVIFEMVEKDFASYVDMMGSLATSAKTDPTIRESFKVQIARCKPEITRGDFCACDRFDVTQRLSAIDFPVLVVTAEDDKLTPPKYGIALAQGIKNATRSHIIDAGHIVPMEKPGDVNKAILQFLDQAGL
jgi:pimeloyl-ACP methyl ester carboxylesterase